MKGVLVLVALLLSGCFAMLPQDMRSPRLRATCGMATPVPAGKLMSDPGNNYNSVDSPYREYSGFATTPFYAVLPGIVVRAENGPYTSTIVVDSPHPTRKGESVRLNYHFGKVLFLDIQSGSTVVAGQYLGVLGEAPGFRDGPSLRIQMIAPTCGHLGTCFENPGELMKQAATCELGDTKIAKAKPAPLQAKKPPTALAKGPKPKRPPAPRR